METLLLWEPRLPGLLIIKRLDIDLVPIIICCYPAGLDPEPGKMSSKSSPIQLTPFPVRSATLGPHRSEGVAVSVPSFFF